MKIDGLNDELMRLLNVMKNDTLAMVQASVYFGMDLARHLSGADLPSDKLADTLADVANGDLTLQPSAAEIRQRLPEGREAPKDLERIRAENQKVSQIIAHLFVEAFSRTQR